MFRKPLKALSVLCLVMYTTVSNVQAQDICDRPNILWNCNFDEWVGAPPRQVPSGWTPFVLQGDLVFMKDIDTVFGAPALRMWSDGGTFLAGIHTRVGDVEPGVAYKASLGWAAPNAPDTFGRQLGIDPTGGTDPSAPTVVWGPQHWGEARIVNYPVGEGPNIDVSVVAEADTITLFILVDHNRSTGDNYIFIDAITMVIDPVQPTPTSTPVPATATSTWTSTPAPTPEPTPTQGPPASTSAPTVTPTPAPASKPTVTLAPPTCTATATPTVTSAPPSPTATLWPITLPPVAGAETLAASASQTDSASSDTPLLAAGLGSLSASVLIGGAVAITKRQRRRRARVGR